MDYEKDCVSIIIPVYNIQSVVAQCIKSVINQTYKNLEIIIVNDGSKDKSQKICEKFANKDKRIELINQKNTGLEIARMNGIRVSTGKYIMHVDGDDWIANNTVEKLVSCAKQDNADVVIASAYRVLDGWKLIKKKNYSKIDEKVTVSHNDFIKNYYISFFGITNISVSMWGKLYKSELVKNNKIKLLNSNYGEDLNYNIQMLPLANSITIIPDYLYYYRYGGMTANVNLEIFESAKKMFNLKCEMLQKYEVPDAEKYIAYEMKNYLLTYIENLLFSESKTKEEIVEIIRKEINQPEMKLVMDILRKTGVKVNQIYNSLFNEDYNNLVELMMVGLNKRKLKRKIKYILSKVLKVI